ncbi:GNAT family N-acetyltransferase [Cognaticolwellia mytili]|uniref:GNAT family N-acetyltransferase n=1 Tax=Cognaticolwellia mytili TaxID=1888913 RepID=UPI000A177FD2|nr:GNAT family N-acetyltransferase [Cognaticolwellia mytili]
MEIKRDDLAGGEVIRLLEEHLTDMYATSPAESVHALDVDALKDPTITFYSCWQNGELLGCAALRELNANHVELKSMRTATNARNLGVASTLLKHLLSVATERGYKKISLETGSMDFFKPARALYKNFGFEYCGPFGDYQLDENSRFMMRNV